MTHAWKEDQEQQSSSLAAVYRVDDAFLEKSNGRYWEEAAEDDSITKGPRTYNG